MMNKHIRRALPALLGICALLLSACGNADPGTSLPKPNDAVDAAADTGAAEQGTAEGGSDAMSDSAGDAAASRCLPCLAHYHCVVTGKTSGTTDLDGTPFPNGTCGVGTMKLECGGGGVAGNGQSLTWEWDGSHLVVAVDSFQLDCTSR
jgi:hypothetical protein